MASRLNPKILLILLMQLAAFWPAWGWYVKRLSNSGESVLGLLCLAAAGTLLYHENRHRPAQGMNYDRLILPGVLTLVYGIGYFWLPPLFRAAIALLSLLATLWSCGICRRIPPAVIGLTLLALPIMASLQFYFGYPLRSLTAIGSAALLSLNGLSVEAQGAGLLWNDQFILVDAPCSGLRMLRTGFFLILVLGGFFRLGNMRLIVAMFAGLPLIIWGNIWRATALFYVESDSFTDLFSGWWHDAVGMVIFALTAVLLCLIMQKLGRPAVCETS